MKKKIPFFLLLFWLTAGAQDMQLTKKQMYQDFDELINILQECNAQLPFRKAVTEIDQLQLAKDLRLSIDSINGDIHKFNTLLNNVLNYMYDIHARKTKEYFKEYDNLKNIDTVAILKSRQQTNRSSRKYIFPGNPIFIDGKYFYNGIYRLINIENGDTILLHDPQVISYNGTPYEKYVQQNLVNFASSGIRWDYEKKEYYATTSLVPFSGKLTLQNHDRIIELDLNQKYNIELTQFDTFNIKTDIPKLSDVSRGKKVFYFEKDQILYIYLNNMIDPENQISEKVKEAGAGKKITKIIIDVRGNSGGSDKVWHNLLKAIVTDTLIYNPIMAFKNTKRLKKLYSYDNAFTNIKKLKVKNLNWMPGESFLVTDFSPIFLIPDSNSLQFDGNVYILQDKEVYSAAHSLTTYASHVEQLISVGEPTGLFSGFGLSPALFQLKYSKFTFRLETAIDITDAAKPIDVYQDFPEIIITIPPEKKCEYIKDQFFDRQCEEYLYRYDYLFQQVLKME